ncbi:protein FAM187B isoform X1 [Peromyscus eremicus]|uniref:protein FAM187B isoform X1 n=2 Tax=Peromyscus eremicus TaxID=42410 RepID=UPI0027DDF706|nr:protein FAM187B isoform X1 [Peromyscus eremicus]
MSRLVASAQPPSQSTMLTILWILLSFVLPVLGLHLPVSCPRAKECQLALLSSNDALLECSISKAHWFFFGLDTGDKPISLSIISNTKQNPDGSLLIKNPSPFNTGLYECRDKNGNQVTGYKIDFQDIKRLHVTHIDLGQKPLANATLNLGHREVLYTRWEPWQKCNSCKSQGERKRLGYCYVKEPLEEPIPCGFYLGETKRYYDRVKPEMQVENCHEMCQGPQTSGDYVIFDNFRLTESDSTQLTCPFASIYRPVRWETNGTALTWRQQLSGEDLSSFMDLYSGGRQLQIFQPAIYRCFVQQELIAQFNPITSVDLLEAESQSKGPGQRQFGKADSVLRGLQLVLLMVLVLVVGGLLCKVVFRPIQGKKNQVLLVK